MRPSSRLYFDPDVIYEDKRARERARWLYHEVSREVRSSTEVETAIKAVEGQGQRVHALAPEDGRAGRFLSLRRRKGETSLSRGKDDHQCLRKDSQLQLVAEVADSYPRLLVWLAEGRVSRYWNVFGIWIAIFRAIPGLRRLVWLVIFKPVYRHAPWHLALHEVILQAVRYELNGYDDKLALDLDARNSAQGLSVVNDIAMMTHTDAREELRMKIQRMSSGCIGVSGLRGVGKSALIRDFCSHRYGTPMSAADKWTELPGLRFEVEAPIRYDAREFLIHLYTCLCRAVLADVRLNPTSFIHRIVLSLLLPRSIRPVALLRTLAGMTLLVLAIGLAYRAVADYWPIPSWALGTWEWLGAATAFAGAVVVSGWRTRQALIEVRQILTLAADAQSRLEKLHFQRTDTHSYGGSLSGPRGAALNVSAARSLTEQTMSMPELADDYRDFVERVVAALQQVISDRKHKKHQLRPKVADAGVRLVIGIDEMDQIEDTRSAGRFLAELRSVFGTPNCVYLISVSPGTLAAADELEIPVRNSASTIFDEMIWVEPLNLAAAQELLNHRMVGLPAECVALCYVLSGGLPRELLRIARAISAISSETPAANTAGKAAKQAETIARLKLARIVEGVITDELAGLRHRVMAHAVSLKVAAAPRLLGLLLGDSHRPMHDSRCPGRSADIEVAMHDLSQLWKGERRKGFADSHGEISARTAEICDNFMCGLYFLLTVQKLFMTELELAAVPTHPEAQKGTHTLNDDDALRALTRARVALGTNPYLAAQIIGEARTAFTKHAGLEGLFADIEPAFLKPAEDRPTQKRPPARGTDGQHEPGGINKNCTAEATSASHA